MSENRPTVPNFLRPNEIQECEEDKRTFQRMLKQRDYDRRVQHQGVLNSLKAVEKRLQQAPPDLSPEQRDRASKRITELEGQLKEGMLSHEEMRRNPPGAVAQNVRWERANKRRVMEWKNLQLALHKGASHTDTSAMLNIARLRPHTNHLPMGGAQIQSTVTMSFPSEAYKEGWERIFGSGDTEKDDMRQRLSELEALLSDQTS
jgi:hypothetical protein